MEYFVISAKFVPLKYYTLSSQLRRLTSFSVGCSGRRILSPGQIAVMRKWSITFLLENKFSFFPGTSLFLTRAVASLTVPGGQEFHFPHFFLKSRLSFLIFPQTFTHFFLILALRVGESPTREGPGYTTVSHTCPITSQIEIFLPRDFHQGFSLYLRS